MAKALTDARIRSIKSDIVRREYPDALPVGLFFIAQAAPSTARSWAVRYRDRATKKSRKVTLGSYPLMPLKAARDKATEVLKAVSEGRDPAREKQTKSAAKEHQTVEAAIEEFIRLYVANKRPKTIYERNRVLRREVIPPWRNRQLQSIAKRDVIALLDEIAVRSTCMRDQTFAYIRKFFNWAVARDWLAKSPCEGVEKLYANRPRERTLSDHELRLMWQASEKLDWQYKAIVRLLVLTGQRRNEVVNMTQAELGTDRDGNRIWSLSGERTKNGKPHVVPLSPQAIAILDDLPEVTGDMGFLFAAIGDNVVTSFSVMKKTLDAEIAKLNGGKPIGHWTLHDLRRSVVTGLNELGIAPHYIEAVVNHISGARGGIAGVYNLAKYAEPKREALNQVGRAHRGGGTAGSPPPLPTRSSRSYATA